MLAADRYRAKRLIKRGGMAEVYEGRVQGERGFERKVAIKKVLLDPMGTSAGDMILRGFVDEARIASQLHHANIVAVLDFGYADGLPFQVLELVDGMDLATLISKTNARGFWFNPELALWIAAEIAHALDYAHRARDENGQPMGIVHRDVSPENILISWAGDVKLADFGIAFALKRIETTRIGIVKGKPDFMSPEQKRGEDVDGRTDIFALGRVLKEMAPGDEAIARIVEKATRPLRAHRYASASEMRSDCVEAIAKKGTVDARGALCELMRSLQDTRPPDPHPVAELFDLRLSAHAPVQDSVRRFASVARASSPSDANTEPPPPAEETAVTHVGEPTPVKLTRISPFGTDDTVTAVTDPQESEPLELTPTSTPILAPTMVRPVVEISPLPGPSRLVLVVVMAAALSALAVILYTYLDDREVAVFSEPIDVEAQRAPSPDTKPAIQARPEIAAPAAEPEPQETQQPRGPRHAQAGSDGQRGHRASPSHSRASDRGHGEASPPPEAAAEEKAIDRAALEKKLQHIADLLEKSVGRVPADELKPLEVRYLDLLSASQNAEGDSECRPLFHRAGTLERDLVRAKEAKR